MLEAPMDNILDTVPAEDQAKVYKQLNQIFYGTTSLEQAKSFIKHFKKDFGKRYPTTIERLAKDLDQCLFYFLFPPQHWKRIRTSNKLERLNKELRRRLDVIGRHPDELGCLSLIYGVAIKSNSILKNIFSPRSNSQPPGSKLKLLMKWLSANVNNRA